MGTKLRWVLMAVSGVLFALTLVGVYDVRYYFFDEPVYIDAAQALADGEEVRNWEHPPLGKYFIQAGRSLSTDKVAGSRLPSIAALLVALAFLGLVAERLFAGRTAPGLPGAAAIFLAMTDPFLLNLSKVAMLEVFVLAFTLAGMYFLIRFLQEGRRSDILFMGLAAGLAVATKWSAVPVYAVFFAFVFWREKEAALWGILTAVAVYIGSFVPYLMLHGQTLGWGDLLGLHKSMFQFHRNFNFDYPHQSPWWSWPLQLKPIWLMAETSEQKLQGLFLLGNLITYILGPLGLLWLNIRRPGWPSLLLFAGYASTLIFWSVAGRRTYFYYYLMCSPFIYLGALAMLWQLYKHRVWLGVTALGSVAIVFAIYFPIVRFMQIPTDYTKALFFMPKWLYLFQ